MLVVGCEMLDELKLKKCVENANTDLLLKRILAQGKFALTPRQYHFIRANLPDNQWGKTEKDE